MITSKKGFIALTMVCAIVLSACSNEPSKTPFKLDMMFLSKPKVVIAVEENLKDTTMDGMTAFAKKVNDMSKGDMAVEILYCKDPIDEMTKRTADMAYTSSKPLLKYTNLFQMLESPFYFRNYKEMTMTLNSRSFTDIVKNHIEEKLGAELLATMFSDASIILSGDEYIEDAVSIEKLDITLRENEEDTNVFLAMNANVTLSTENDMIEGFNSGDLKTIECRISRLTEAKKPLDEDFFYITETLHNLTLEYLFVSKEYMDTQNNEQMAIIRDGAAVLLGTIDKIRIDEYEFELDRLIVNGGELSRYAPDTIRKKAKETMVLQKKFEGTNGWNIDYYDNIQSIIR